VERVILIFQRYVPTVKKLIWTYCVLVFYMAFFNGLNRLNLAKLIKYFLILDIVVYCLLLLIFPGLWFIGYIFMILILGMILSYWICERLRQDKDSNWKKPAEVLVSVNVSLNAIFCIIISAAIIAGVFIAASAI